MYMEYDIWAYTEYVARINPVLPPFYMSFHAAKAFVRS
jgi:hypothetical protein